MQTMPGTMPGLPKLARHRINHCLCHQAFAAERVAGPRQEVAPGRKDAAGLPGSCPRGHGAR
jgi:hypothetical protein